MLDEPKVSILMNCFNGEKYLRDAIDSILAQTYANWEVVFWDNRSSDRSAEIFKAYIDKRLRYFLAPEHTNLGGGRARAWEYLTGDFIAVLDADDVWFPTKLEKQVPLFDDPEVGIVISDTLFFTETGEKPLYREKYPPTGWVFEQLLTGYFVSLETLVFRRVFVENMPRAFDSDFSAIADFDLVVRLSRISKLALCPEILAKWRMHLESDTWRNPWAFIEERERWIEKQMLEDATFARDYSNSIGRFKNKGLRTKAMHLLQHQRRGDAFHALMLSEFDHWHAWMILVFCAFPFSGAVLSWILKKRAALK
jgi:glycosyltransferase involved in cell wall biosynthesis